MSNNLDLLLGHSYIPNALRSQTGIIVSTDQIIDLNTNRMQNELNEEAAKNKNIDDVVNYYAVHSSTSIEEGVELNWLPNEIPTMNSELRYLWNYEEFKYSDGTSSTTTPGVIGVYSSGRGIESMEYFYLVSSDGENSPSPDDENWKTISPTTDDVNKYLWQKIVTKYNDSDENSEGEVNISLVGVHGAPGMDGVDGKDGSMVEYVYCLSDATSVPDENNESRPVFSNNNWPVAVNNQDNDSLSNESKEFGWQLEPASVTTDKPYLWMSMRKKPQGSMYWGNYGEPTLWAVYGKSILKTESKYLTWSTTQEPTLENGQIIPWDDELWKTYSESTDDTNKYLWKWTRTTMTGGDVRDIKEIIGVHGAPGMDGSNIEYIYILYTPTDEYPKPGINYNKGFALDPSTGTLDEINQYDSTIDGFIPEGWLDEPVDVDPEHPYLFMSVRKKAAGSSNWGDFSEPTLWAVYGKSVLSIESKYQVNNDKNNAPAGGWDDKDDEGNPLWLTQSPAVTNENRCLWKLTRTTLTGGDFKDVCELVGVQGDPGVDGTNIEYIYKLSATEKTPEIPSEDNDGNTDTNVSDFIPKGWTDEPQDVSSDFPFQYMSSRKFNQTEDKWDDFIGAKLWSVYGKSVIRIEKLYQISSKSDLHPDTPASDGNPYGDGDAITGPDKWTSMSPAVTDDQPYLWEKTITYFTGGVVNEPIYAVIGVKGTKGTDAEDIEYIYKLTETYDKPLIDVDNTPTGSAVITNSQGELETVTNIPFNAFGNYSDLLPIGWTDEPGDVDVDNPYQWYSYRKYNNQNKTWQSFSTPILWSKYGADGADGSGILNVTKRYCISSAETETELLSDSTVVWMDNSPATNGNKPNLWCHTVTQYTGGKADDFTYELIGKMGDKGIDADTIDYIYLLSHQSPTESFKSLLAKSLEQIEAPLSEPITITLEDEGEQLTWLDDPQDVSSAQQYLYQAYATGRYDRNDEKTWTKYGNIILWSKYGDDGNGVESIKVSYAVSEFSSESEMKDNDPNFSWENMDWSEFTPSVSNRFRYLWKKTITTYQKALIDDESTGEDETIARQKVTYEMVGAMGEPGIDGAGLEYIYKLTQTSDVPYIPAVGMAPDDTELNSSYNKADFIPEGWSDDMVMKITDENGAVREVTLSAEYPYAWRAQRKYNSITGEWGYFTEYAEVDGETVNTILPKCVARHGVDGRGITQTIYTYNVSSDISIGENGEINPDPDTIKPNEDGVIVTDPHQWPTLSPAVDDTYKYLWRHTEVFYNDNTSNTLMELIGEKGEKGIDGADIEYAYMLKDKEETPEKPNTDPGQLGNPNGVDVELDKWFDDPQDVSDDYPYLYICIGKKLGNSWEWDTPMLWAKYGKDATILLSSENWYGVGTSGTNHDDIDNMTNGNIGWQTTSPSTDENNRFLWKKSVKVYSKYFEGGEEGSVDDETKRYTVTEYDMIGIAGQKGVDGSSSDYIYTTTVKYSDAIKEAISKAAADNIQQNEIPLSSQKIVDINVENEDIRLIFTDDPADVTEQVPYLWILQASYDNTNSQWSKYGNAHLWSKYGADGTLLLHSENWYGVNNSPDSYDGITWQETSPGTDENNRYLWKKSIKEYSKEVAVPDQDGIESGTAENGRFQLIEYDMIGVAGEKGVDGTRIDYIYVKTKENDPTIKNQIKEAALNIEPLNFETSDTVVDSVSGITFYDDPQDVTAEYPYLWILQSEWMELEDESTLKKYWGWSPYGKLTIWAKYGADGADGNGILEINTAYLISDVSSITELENKIGSDGLYTETNILPTTSPSPNVWYDNSPEVTTDNKFLWKRTKTIYSKATTGTIGNGNEDYKWEMIGSIGKDGIDGAGSEWAYFLTNEDGSSINPPQGEVTLNPTEILNTPELYERYKNYISGNKVVGLWCDDPQGVDKDHRYEWMVKRSKLREKTEGDITINYGAWGEWSKPSLYARYSKDGIGIKETTAFFLSTNSLVAPDINIEYNDTTSDPDSSNPKTYNKYKEFLKNNGWTENKGSANKEARFLYEVQLVAYGETDAEWTGDETDLNFDIFGPNNIGGYVTETKPNLLRNSDFESVGGWKCEVKNNQYDIPTSPSLIDDTRVGIITEDLRNDSGRLMKSFYAENPYFSNHSQDLLINEVELQPDTWYTMSAYIKSNDVDFNVSNRMSFLISETGLDIKKILSYNDPIYVDGIELKVGNVISSPDSEDYDEFPHITTNNGNYIINRTNEYEIHIDFGLTDEWQRHYITFKTAKDDIFNAEEPCRVAWRWDGIFNPSNQSTGYIKGYVGMPKIEINDLVTPWCKTADEQSARTIGAIEEYYRVTNTEHWGSVSDLPDVAVGENDPTKSKNWYFDDSNTEAIQTPYYNYIPGTVKPDAKFKYLWNLEVIRYDQGDTKDVYIETLTPQLMGTYAVGIADTEKKYLISNSNVINPYPSTVPSGYSQYPNDGEWLDNSPIVTNEHPFLWERTVIKYEDDTTTTPKIICLGSKGIDSSTVEYIYCATSVENIGIEDPNSENPAIGSDISSKEADGFIPFGWLDDNPGTSVINKYIYQSYREKSAPNEINSDGVADYMQKWGAFSTPKLIATYATNQIFADLDNEMDSVPCSYEGRITSNTTITTNVNMYEGSDKITLTNISVIDKDGLEVTPTVSGQDTKDGKVEIVLPEGTELSKDRYNIKIELQAIDSKNATQTKQLTLTIAAIKAGQKGTPGRDNYVADLDNEMDSIALTSNGNPYNTDSIETNVWVSKGNSKLRIASIKINDIQISNVVKTNLNNGFECGYVATGGDIYKIMFNPVSTNTIIDAKTSLPISLQYVDENNENQTANLNFTINGIRAAKDGKDGTSINVAGSYDNFELFEDAWFDDENSKWKAPSNPSDCYVVGYNLYVWNGTEWKDVGPFKGQDGKDGKDGIDGKDAQAQYISIVFALATKNDSGQWVAPTKPNDAYGSYLNPVPTGWEDGIPAANNGAPVYSCKRRFTSDGQFPQDTTWSPVTLMADSADFDVEYCIKDTYDNLPSGHPNTNTEWSNTASENAIWMATSNKTAGGSWSDWVVTRIKGEKGDQGIQGIQGIQGERGEQGIQGPKGTDGQPTYFHIKYASDSNGTNMNEVGGDYMGTYVDNVKDDSDNPKDYNWVLTKGVRGDQGIPGENGADGTSSYLHIAYANSADGKTDFSVDDSTNKSYIGQYVDSEVNDSDNPEKYKWTKIEGPAGKDAQGQYTSIVFALATKNAAGQWEAPTKPNDGSYLSPVPTGWFDGVPTSVDGAPVYSSKRRFTSDGQFPQDTTWSPVTLMADSADFDVEYCIKDTYDNLPSGHPNTNTEWSNTASENAIWMATSNKAVGGEWSDWVVTRIKGEKGDQGIQGIQGIQGERGEQGIQGPKGADGQPTYFHIKYASDSNGTNMNEVGGDYMGTYVDNIEDDSEDPKKYNWVLTKGIQGDQGIPGENGADGTSSYLHIAYANSADGKTDFSVDDSTNKSYIGQYVDSEVNDSDDPEKYKWTKIEGPAGKDGITPQAQYTSIVFALATKNDSGQWVAPNKPDDVFGSYLSPVPAGWEDGIPASNNGAPVYSCKRRFTSDGQFPQDTTWSPVTLMADSADFDVEYCIKDIYDNLPSGHPNINTEWSNTASENAIWMATSNKAVGGEWSDWVVTRIKGEKGDQGIQGIQGIQGERGEQGIQGPKGADGQPTYFHIKYASDSEGANMNEVGGDYMGTYVDNVEDDSDDPKKYKWVLTKGIQGDQGIQGENGADGTSSYLHIAYANSADGKTDFSVDDSTNKSYIGQYVDSEVNDSDDPEKYKWTKIEGPEGPAGKDGITPQVQFASVVFALATKNSSGQWIAPTKPGSDKGSYSNPVPDGWSDGIPASIDGAPVYSCKRRFTSDGQSPQDTDWSTPLLMADSADFDVEYCIKDTYDNLPSGHPNTNTEWSNTTSENAIWMATSNKAVGGEWSDWVVTRIKGEKGDQGIQGIQGIQGPEGKQGIQGEKGADGQPTYFHIKYASNSEGADMNDTGGDYMGTYVDNIEDDSEDPKKYKWVLTKGAQGKDGAQGIPGENGADGTSSYLHIAYANNADGSEGFDIFDSTNKSYIGQYVDSEVNDSDDPEKYKWTKIEGPEGPAGTSPIFADLDNEMDSIALNSDGKTTSNTTLTTNVSMYKGNAKLDLTNLTATATEGSTSYLNGSNIIKCDKTTGKVTVTINTNQEILAKNVIKITLSAEGESRDLYFTINGIKAAKDGADGAKGVSPILSKLQPSVNQIVKLKDGGTNPSSTITCTFTSIQDGKTVSNPTDYILYYSINGDTETPLTGDGVNPTSILNNIKFILKNGSGTILDTETIPVITEAKDGEDGKDGEKGDPGESPILYRLIPSVKQVVIDKDGKYSVDEITCKVTKTVNDVTIDTTESGITINCYKDGATTATTLAPGTGIINPNSFSHELKLELVISGQVHDVETISLVSDGLTAKPNLLRNTNFDMLKTDGKTLLIWNKTESDYIVDGYEGYNAIYKTFNTAGGEIATGSQQVNLKASKTYTLSLYSRYNGKPNSSTTDYFNTYGYGITFNQTPASKLKIIDSSNIHQTNFGATSDSSCEIYIGTNWKNDEGWVKHSITFEVLEDISSIDLRLFTWACNKDSGTTYYYSQLKLEESEIATPYIKHMDDYKSPLKSTVFKKSATALTDLHKPTGGDYNNPIPNGWSDGIPSEGTGAIWSSTNTFYAAGINEGWSTPQIMADSADFDVCYSEKETPGALPTAGSNDTTGDWINTASENAIWMATCNKTAGGSWSAWVKTRIKGEKGADGNPGKDSEIYQLVPSITQITRSNSGITSPEAVHCNVNKIVGSTTSTGMPTDGKIKYSIDGADEEDYISLSNINTNNVNKNIKFTLYDSSNNVLDTETIALVKSALNPGVNLINNSSFRDGDKYWVVNNGNVNDEKYTYTAAASTSTETNMLAYNADNTFTFKPNTWYTISFSYKGNVGTYNGCPSMLRVLIKNTVSNSTYTIGDYSAGMYINGNPVTITNGLSATPTIDGIKYTVSANSTSNGTSCTCPSYNGTDWNTFSLTFKTKESLTDTESKSKIYFHASPNASGINIKQIKLEEGKEATGWNLSNNDSLGRGIKEVVEYYKLSNSDTNAPETSGTGWSDTIQQVTSEMKYLWNYEKTIYTDDSTSTTAPVIISTYNKEPIQLIIDKPVITCAIDPVTKKTLNEKTYTIYVRLMQGGEYLDISNYVLTYEALNENDTVLQQGTSS